MAVNYKPAETQTVIPYLIVPDADKELAFVKEVFGAKEVHVSRDPGGRIVHAQVKIGEFQLFGQASYGTTGILQGEAEKITKCNHHATCGRWLLDDKAGYGVQGIKEKVGVQLHAQCVETRDGELPLQIGCTCAFRLKVQPHSPAFECEDEHHPDHNV